MSEPLSAATLTALPPALAEELAKALEAEHENDHDFDPEWDYTDDDNRYLSALAPILSRALTEAAEEAAGKMREAAADLMENLIDGEKVPTDWDDWYESRTIEAIPAAIRAIPNPYLTEKEQSNG